MDRVCSPSSFTDFPLRCALMTILYSHVFTRSTLSVSVEGGGAETGYHIQYPTLILTQTLISNELHVKLVRVKRAGIYRTR